MTKRFIFQLIFCSIFMLANIAKDFIPIGKIHLKKQACLFQIDKLLENDIFLDIKTKLSKKELDDIKKLKDQYCKPHQLK